ncbi:unnamed protein product, partial [Ectocarpus fasciculatus]
ELLSFLLGVGQTGEGGRCVGSGFSVLMQRCLGSDYLSIYLHAPSGSQEALMCGVQRRVADKTERLARVTATVWHSVMAVPIVYLSRECGCFVSFRVGCVVRAPPLVRAPDAMVKKEFEIGWG